MKKTYITPHAMLWRLPFLPTIMAGSSNENAEPVSTDGDSFHIENIKEDGDAGFAV